MKTWTELAAATLPEILAWAETQPWARAMAACQQDAGWHAEGDVWTHTRMVCAELEKLDAWPNLDPTARLKLLLTALFHDSGKPATTAAIGVTAALRTLGAKRVVFMTKLDNAVRVYEGAYLTSAGFDIVGGRGAGADNAIAHTMPPEFWYDATMACRDDHADAYFITCTNVRAMGAIERLEKNLGRPVVTSNQALLWHALRTAGVRDPIDGLGTLLKIEDSKYVQAAA